MSHRKVLETLRGLPVALPISTAGSLVAAAATSIHVVTGATAGQGLGAGGGEDVVRSGS